MSATHGRGDAPTTSPHHHPLSLVNLLYSRQREIPPHRQTLTFIMGTTDVNPSSDAVAAPLPPPAPPPPLSPSSHNESKTLTWRTPKFWIRAIAFRKARARASPCWHTKGKHDVRTCFLGVSVLVDAPTITFLLRLVFNSAVKCVLFYRICA
jgi:hypothetical protein